MLSAPCKRYSFSFLLSCRPLLPVSLLIKGGAVSRSSGRSCVVIQKKTFLLQECFRCVNPQDHHVHWLSPCQVSVPGPPVPAPSKPASAGGNEPSGWVLAALWHGGDKFPGTGSVR